jgi:hypothetical protein
MGFAKVAMASLAIWQPDIHSSASYLKIRSECNFFDSRPSTLVSILCGLHACIHESHTACAVRSPNDLLFSEGPVLDTHLCLSSHGDFEKLYNFWHDLFDFRSLASSIQVSELVRRVRRVHALSFPAHSDLHMRIYRSVNSPTEKKMPLF